MQQRFKRSMMVRVKGGRLPDFDGIIDGSYSQLYGGSKTDSYSLYVVEGGKIVNRVAWYDEGDISRAPAQNRVRAERLVEQYNISH